MQGILLRLGLGWGKRTWLAGGEEGSTDCKSRGWSVTGSSVGQGRAMSLPAKWGFCGLSPSDRELCRPQVAESHPRVSAAWVVPLVPSARAFD